MRLSQEFSVKLRCTLVFVTCVLSKSGSFTGNTWITFLLGDNYNFIFAAAEIQKDCFLAHINEKTVFSKLLR